jgi:hypothetical protein
MRLDAKRGARYGSELTENRLNRFRESDILRHIFERIVMAAMAKGLVKGESFAVDASVIEANASRYHGIGAGRDRLDRCAALEAAVAEYLAALAAGATGGSVRSDDAGDIGPETGRQRRYERKAPKVISPSDPWSAWTAKANRRVQFGYGLNYLIDLEHKVIIDVEATPARTYDEVEATKTMIDRAEWCFALSPKRLIADTAYARASFSAGWSRRRRSRRKPRSGK